MPTRSAGPIAQDWEPVVLHKTRPKSQDIRDPKVVNQALRTGKAVETVKKVVVGTNKKTPSTVVNARKLDEETESAALAKVSSEVRLAIHVEIGVGKKYDIMAEVIVDFAASCQAIGLVPVLTPEIITDDTTNIQTAADFTTQVLVFIFDLLKSKHILLSSTLLNLGFVVPGLQFEQDLEQISNHTLNVLQCSIPLEVKVVFFLSGKVSKKDCTRLLNILNQDQRAWKLSFSFGRALQQKILKTGEEAQISAFEEFKLVAKAIAEASVGRYVEDSI